MRQSKMTKAMALILSLTMITSVFVGNTLSRYVTSVSSTDSARVAVWGINGEETQMNLFSSEYLVGDKKVIASNNNGDDTFDKVMAPGAKGEAEFNIINFEQDVAPEVAYEVKISLDDSAIAEEIKNNPSVQWKLDDGAYGTWDDLKTAILSLSGSETGSHKYGPGEFATAFQGTQEHKIAWQWVMDNNNNVMDTEMGNLALTNDLNAVIKVSITAQQVNDGTVKDIALNGLTYEDIFTSLNAYQSGDFESGVIDNEIWKGSPNITDTVSNSGTYSLDISGSSAQQILKRGFHNFRGIEKYYIAAKVRIDNYNSGTVSIRFNLFSDIKTYYKADISESTNGKFVTVSAIQEVGSSTQNGGGQLFIGTYGDSIDLEAYVDDVVIIPLNKVGDVSKYTLDQAYNKYTTFEDKGKTYTETFNNFISAMNAKAQEIGMTNSNFDTPGGLDGTSSTTSRDLMKLAVESLKYERLLNIFSQKSKDITITGSNPRIVSLISNSQNSDLESKYPLIIRKGGAISSSNTSIYNFIGITEINGKTVVGVVMNSTSRDARYDSLEELFDISSNVLDDPSYDTSLVSVSNSESAISCVVTEDGYEILYEQNADNKYIPASTSKLLSVLTALDYIGDDNEIFTIKSLDIQPAGSFGEFIYAGDCLTYESAFYGMMLVSDNTLAHAIARIISERYMNN